jgi:hypothetical protein
VPPVATLISRLAARYLGTGRREIARTALQAAARSLTAPAGRDSGDPVARPAPPRGARPAFGAWLAGLVLFVVVIVNADLVLSHDAAAAFRLAAGCVLGVEGAALLPRRSPFRAAVVGRLSARWIAGVHGRVSLTRRSLVFLTGAGVSLLGVAWVAAGTLELLRGAIALL